MLSSLCLGEEHTLYALQFCVSSVILTFSTCSSETLLPGNDVAEIYHEIAKKVMDFIMNFTVISEDCCGIN
jgi:tRNA pseudouridine13 synthase